MHFATRVRTWRVARLYSEIALSRKPFGIGHMYIYTFLLRMTDTMTSQNIDLSCWVILYVEREKIVKVYWLLWNWFPAVYSSRNACQFKPHICDLEGQRFPKLQRMPIISQCFHFQNIIQALELPIKVKRVKLSLCLIKYHAMKT
jgi:hypothetical protein